MKKQTFKIPFNKPFLSGRELNYISEAIASRIFSGDGPFHEKCCRFLEKRFSTHKVFLTPSGTHALELASVLLDLKPGDEVIVPSFTFPSTANAFMLRGAKPVFVDIRIDTKNIDENLIEEKITSRTKAMFIVHYAGVACEMDKIGSISKRRNLHIIEDAAHAINGTYKNQFLGTFGTFGCFSFHESKNLNMGEGGALAINRPEYVFAAEVFREKGTNRTSFLRGEMAKYTWQGLGSSILTPEISAAFLFAQLEHLDKIQGHRRSLYERYVQSFQAIEKAGLVQLPKIPDHCRSSYHMFYLVLPSEEMRNELISYLKEKSIMAVFHYLPLHTSPAGKSLGYKAGDFPITETVSTRLVRLPLYNEMTFDEQDLVIESVCDFFKHSKNLAPFAPIAGTVL